MAYIPKSKVSKLNTPGGEFIIKRTNQDYIGDYIELSNGKYYIGSDPTQLGDELIAPELYNKIENNRNTTTYSNLKPNKAKFLSKVKTIYPTKSLPTEEDYNKGYYTRYFAKKVNELRGYMEIDIDIFNSIVQRKKEYDFYLYEVGSIVWNLKNGTTTSNFKNLQILERTFKFISIIFPILNEFERIDGILTTQGGELYYENGREYIGPYHIHPDKGPMVGAQHISGPHELLFYSKDLQNQNQEIEDFMNQNLFEIQIQQKTEAPIAPTTNRSTSTQTQSPSPSYGQSSPSTPSSSPSSPSAPSAPSSGGGGGY